MLIDFLYLQINLIDYYDNLLKLNQNILSYYMHLGIIVLSVNNGTLSLPVTSLLTLMLLVFSSRICRLRSYCLWLARLLMLHLHDRQFN